MEEKELLMTLQEQEETLQFSEFTSETAFEIGLKLIEKAKKRKVPITIDIVRNGHQLFHYALDGSVPDHAQWIIRKNNVVHRFHKSSLAVGTMLKIEGKTIEEKYHISSKDYAAYGGAFPIIVKNVGIVGTITVSGSRQLDDHLMIVEVLKEFLG